jgi:hypothetical protein
MKQQALEEELKRVMAEKESMEADMKIYHKIMNKAHDKKGKKQANQKNTA